MHNQRLEKVHSAYLFSTFSPCDQLCEIILITHSNLCNVNGKVFPKETNRVLIFCICYGICYLNMHNCRYIRQNYFYLSQNGDFFSFREDISSIIYFSANAFSSTHLTPEWTTFSLLEIPRWTCVWLMKRKIISRRLFSL